MELDEVKETGRKEGNWKREKELGEMKETRTTRLDWKKLDVLEEVKLTEEKEDQRRRCTELRKE